MTLQDGQVMIDGPTTLRVERVFRVTLSQFHTDTLHGTYRRGIVLEFETHADTAEHERGATSEHLYVRQLFPGSDQCSAVRRTLEYRRATSAPMP